MPVLATPVTLTPVTLELGHGDLFPNKSQVICRCTFCMNFAILCQPESKFIQPKKAVQVTFFTPSDLKTRSR